MKDHQLFKKLTDIAVSAGDAVMQFYSADYEVEFKKDKSPLTAADKAAHDIITTTLKSVSFRGETCPVVSEEGVIPPYDVRKNWGYFWLIDPLDGTKEFISGNGEFTVNIALIGGDSPVLGVVYLPVDRILYFGGREWGSFRAMAAGSGLAEKVKLPLDIKRDRNVLVAAGSRSHRSNEFDDWVKQEAERRRCSSVEILTAGSSLKFCLAAEGRIDVYPRFGPTMEWDTAAAHAVAEGAGRRCTGIDGSRMCYNKPEMRNSAFLVS